MMRILQSLPGKVKRTILCQSKRLFYLIWHIIKPQFYSKHPVLMPCLWYASQVGRFPDLKHPRTFNEQLIFNNIVARTTPFLRELYVKCADKYEVRSYLEEKGLQDYLNTLYGAYDTVDSIPFDGLPEEFVIKTTSGCGQNFVCDDKTKINIDAFRALLNGWNTDSATFGYKTGEWHYSMIMNRFIVEKYLSQEDEPISLIDYKFHCIFGKVVGILVCYDRDPKTHTVNLDYYDLNWTLTDGIYPQFHPFQRPIEKPKSFDEMIIVAEKLAEGFKHVRVDLYEVDGHPIFGEMTFTPAGNIMSYYRPWVLEDMMKKYKAYE